MINFDPTELKPFDMETPYGVARVEYVFEDGKHQARIKAINLLALAWARDTLQSIMDDFMKRQGVASE